MTDASRKLRRSSNKMIAGVCGGIAEWLGWDVTVVRVLYVILTIISFGFGGVIAYIVLWIVMPRPES
jgi:phage shock protein C